MTTLMTVVAVLFILTLLGFIAAVGSIIAGALGFKAVFKRAQMMIEPPKNVVMETVRYGQGLAGREVPRFKRVAGNGKRAFDSVMLAKDEIVITAKSIDVEEAKEAFTQVQASASKATTGVMLVKNLITVISLARRK